MGKTQEKRSNHAAERSRLSEALRRYREQRRGYDRMRSVPGEKGVYRAQRGTERQYRV